MDSGSNSDIGLCLFLVSLRITFDNALLLTFSMNLTLHELALMLEMLKRIDFFFVRHLQSF